MPGGCYLGPRPIDLHLKGFEALGASVQYERGSYIIEAKEPVSYTHLDVYKRQILRSADGYPQAESYERLTHEKEIELMKYINEFTSVVAEAARLRAPHKVCNYIQKLAPKFHSFYNACKVLDAKDEVLSAQRLALVQATRITLKNALTLIGVEAPEKM